MSIHPSIRLSIRPPSKGQGLGLRGLGLGLRGLGLGLRGLWRWDGWVDGRMEIPTVFYRFLQDFSWKLHVFE